MQNLWKRSPIALLLFVLAAGAPAAAADATLEGHWKGRIELPGRALELDLDFLREEGAWKGDVTIPAQGAKDLPLAEISQEGLRVHFKISGVPGDPTFDGAISEDGNGIQGKFTQGGAVLDFVLERDDSDPKEEAAAALDGFDQFIESAMKDWQTVGLAMAIVKDGQTVYAKGFGQRDREQGLPVTPDTLFAIGSCTKAFTTFGLATLVDEGKMAWDTPVIEYLPGWRLYDDYATARITPRDLVTHRSGLPRHDLVWYNNQELTRRELFERLRYLEPNKDLRQLFQYNNHMYVMAGYLLGQLDGSAWEESIQKRILTPLGMSRTNFSVLDSQKSDDFALPYQVHDEQIERMAFRVISGVGPAGSINSSVNDMTRWMRIFLDEGESEGRRLLSSTALRELYTPQTAVPQLPQELGISPASYAMGWGVGGYRGRLRVSHGGAIDGFTARVTLFPQDDLGIVVLTNQNGSAMPALAANHAADRLLKLEFKDWHKEALARSKVSRDVQKEGEKNKESVRVEGTSPAHPLTEYAGEYFHPGYGVLKLALNEEGDGLSMEYNGITAPLAHWHYEVFNGGENPDDRTFEDMKLQFHTNQKGRVDRVSAPFEPAVEDIAFVRRPDRKYFDPAYLARFEGDYVLGSQTFVVKARGEVLTVSLPGQPTYELEPDRDDEFNFKGLSGFSVQFKTESEEGPVAIVKQPNGVFTAKKKL